MELAIDVGGTFTDLVTVDRETGAVSVLKHPTNRANLAGGVRETIEESGVDVADLTSFTHGTTVAINSLIEREGVTTALITTRGARDAYGIGRGNRPDSYDIFFERPRPLVPRSRTLEVDERMMASGEVLTELTEAEIGRVVSSLQELDVEAVAISLLHSYANPAHEQRLARAIADRLPAVYVTASHEILRQYREYERASTTVINSYVGPPVSIYLSKLRQVLSDKGFEGALRIMQSNGGVCGVETAMQKPVSLLESGPVAGIAAASHVGKALGYSRIVAFDMGGTTAKASLSDEGLPRVADGYFVGGYATGQPVMLPVVDVIEVGSGGGSIAALDEQGHLAVGPQSAGANPGPACYRRGGTRPTVTDADLVLGRIGAESFLGGRMPLDRAASVTAIETQVANGLGISAEEAAAAIIAIAVDRMTLAVREVSVANGVDPRDCAMVAFGGAGPVHAVEIARELAIPTVVIPNYPSQFSAYGMLITGVRHDYVRTHLRTFDTIDWSVITGMTSELMTEARERFVIDGLDQEQLVPEFSLDLRYVGQESVLAVRMSANPDADQAERLAADFFALHEKLYGHSPSTGQIEMVNVRLAATIPPSPHSGRARSAAPDSTPATSRSMYFSSTRRNEQVPVVRRGSMVEGVTVTGPALLEEEDTTTFIGRGDVAHVVATGEIIVTLAPRPTD